MAAGSPDRDTRSADRVLSNGSSLVPVPVALTLTLNLPEELVARLTAEATRQRVSVEELVLRLVSASLPVDGDPLETFIGSGASPRTDLGRRHRQIRAGTEGLDTNDL